MSAFDAVASSFDRHRALPDGVAPAIRAAVLACIDRSSRPRLLDLGAGTGRIGWLFVAAGDDYIGVDLSLGMLRAFLGRAEQSGLEPRLVQSNGELLPFPDATFDAVLMVQIFGGMRGWRRVIAEARRVLQSAGALVIGATVTPAEGIDAQMKRRLAAILGEMGVQADRRNVREDVRQQIEQAAQERTRVIAAEWDAERSPRGFLERHRTGAGFSASPEPAREEALRKLATWAAATFGSLDAAVSERHAFELQVFKFQG